MSKIEISFDSIKYNLYEILNVPTDSDESKIKKNFMKLIKNFHPDKNSDLEEEIYYHIVLANQILLNKESRKKYDEFLLGKADTFNELKDSFGKSIKDIEHLFPAKDESKGLFDNKIQELNKKHGFDQALEKESVMDRFNKVKNKRETDEIKIEKENFKTINEFNDKFNSHKSEGGKFRDQIVEFKGAPSELSTYVAGEHYTSLGDLDKLYVEDSVQSAKYSSLDRAFMLQPTTGVANENKSFEERMKEYRNQTDNIKNMKPTEFSTKKFDEW
jgi:curved DNA-binding protein CbpA